MKGNVINRIRITVVNLINKPLLIKKLLINKQYYSSETYFPEEKERKNKRTIFLNQIVHILKHGEINEFYFLYGFDIKNFRNQDDYVSYLEFMNRRNARNKVGNVKSSVGVLRNKLFFSIIAEGFNIKCINNLAYILDGKVVSNDNDEFSGIREYISNLEGHFFVKSINGECGDGVYSLKIKKDEIALNQKILQLDDIVKVFSIGDFVIQNCLLQNNSINQIYPQSINTIRVTTVKNKGNIIVTDAVFRFGARGNNVDNWAQGGVFVPINKNGTLDKYGFFKPKYGTKTDVHPDTGFVFENYEIPFYSEAINEVVKFHKFLDIHSIGWDIAICENGPVIIEGNDNWEVTLPQTVKGFKKLFKENF